MPVGAGQLAEPERSATTGHDPAGTSAVAARRLDTAWLPAVLLGVAAAAFAAVHVARAGHGDISRLVVANGSFRTGPTPAGLTIGTGGYDGQFFYRLALAPWRLAGSVGGLRLDLPLRAQRITYPALAWLASLGGQPRLLPAALLGVNVAGLAAIGLIGGRLAQTSGRHAGWGLLFGSYPGFVFTLARDLSEITDAAALLAGVLAVRRGRYGWAAAAWSAAVLSRESSLLLVGCFAATQLPRWWRLRRPRQADLAWAVPAAAFAAWQGYAAWQLGVWPVASSRAADSGRLLADLPHYLSRWFALGAHNVTYASYAGEFVLLVAAVVLALARTWRRPPGEAYLALAVLGYALLGASLTKLVWIGPADFRVLTPLYCVCLVRGLPARWRLAVLAPATLILVGMAVYVRAGRL